MSSDLASGPLPHDIEDAILNIMREDGIVNLTNKILRTRLEGRYSIEFRTHKAAIDNITQKMMSLPEFQKELVEAERKRSQMKNIGGKGKSRTAAPKRDRSEGGSAKQKKPDDYPKSALSPYILFVGDHRLEVKEKYPDMKNTEILQKMGQMWTDASDAVKEKYKKLAEQDKERFERELKEYKKNGGEVFKRGKKESSSAKDENKPKRQLSSYTFFVNEFRKKHAEIPPKELMKEAGAAWKDLSEKDREPYKLMAQKDKERYEEEKAGRSK